MKIINHRLILVLLLLACLFSISASVYAQSNPFAPPSGSGTPQVTTYSTNASQVGRYQKFEVTFQLNRVYAPDSWLPYYYYDPADPRGIDGVTIDGHFIAPSGRELVVPAFYYQDYVRTLTTTTTTLTPTNNFAWKLRFAPEEVGNYQYYITILDRNGSTRYPASGTLQFQSVQSNSKGFIRVSPRDPRFFEFSNGESYIPNGSGRQWWKSGSALRSADYENTFTEFGRNNINLVRIWDQNSGFGLTVEGPFDGYAYPADYGPERSGVDPASIPRGTRMNQRGNYEEDKIIESAERNGVYIVLSSVGDPYWIWDASINENPPASWSDPARFRYWQRNFRYRVARWGYSTAVLAWEHWNELGHIPTTSDVFRFYQSYSQYQQQTDPFRHLRTTSQGSQTWSPALWSSPAFDITTYHDYMMISRYSADLTYDAANFVYRFAQCLRTPTAGTCGLGLGDGSTWQGGPKPILWTELDTGTANWNEANPQQKGFHDMRWAGLFSPVGMAPLDWSFNSQSAEFTATKYREAKIAGDFFRGMDYAGKGFTYLSTSDVRLTAETINTSNPQLRVLAMRARNGVEAYAWAQNKGNALWNQSTVPAGITATFTIPGMAAGSYKVEIWDTYTGQITNGSTVTANNGQVTVSVSNLSKDVAIKILPVNQPATPTATAAPTSTPVSPTPTRVTPTLTPTFTATLAPTATPTFTATMAPTSTPTLQPTTAVPTSVPPTSVAPTATPPQTGEPGARLDISPANAAPGQTVNVTLNLVNVSNLYGVEASCVVDPAVLSGAGYVGAEGFNESNSFIVAQDFNTLDGSWRIAASRIRPHPAINGSAVAFTLAYTVIGEGSSAVNCSVRVVDPNGWNTSLPVVNGGYSPSPGETPALPPTEAPTVIPPTATPEPSATFVLPSPTPGGASVIAGTANYPGRSDHSGVTVSLFALDTPLAEVTTTSTGAYQFTDVPVGVYFVRLSAPQSLILEYQVLVEADGTVIDLGVNTLVMGDTDSSGAVDLVDASFIGANYGVDGALAPNGDLNRDSDINISDLALVGSSFGLTSPVIPE